MGCVGSYLTHPMLYIFCIVTAVLVYNEDKHILARRKACVYGLFYESEAGVVRFSVVHCIDCFCI